MTPHSLIHAHCHTNKGSYAFKGFFIFKSQAIIEYLPNNRLYTWDVLTKAQSMNICGHGSPAVGLSWPEICSRRHSALFSSRREARVTTRWRTLWTFTLTSHSVLKGHWYDILQLCRRNGGVTIAFTKDKQNYWTAALNQHIFSRKTSEH